MEAAEQFGFNAIGLEPSKDLVRRGKDRGLNLLYGTIENHSLLNQKFDLISFWDVIEHIGDPKLALESSVNLLSKQGVLVINFPNIGTLQSKIMGKRFWWIISVHLTHFTNKTLDRLCLSVGLVPLKKSRYWQILELGYLFEIGRKLRVPLAGSFVKYLPKLIQKWPIPYYASQTTAIYKLNS